MSSRSLFYENVMAVKMRLDVYASMAYAVKI